MLFSVSAHAQFLILYAGILSTFLKDKLLRLFSTGFISKKIFYVMLLLTVVAILLNQQLYQKFLAYYGSFDIVSLWKISVFFVLTLWYASKKLDVVFIFIPLIITAGLFGGIHSSRKCNSFNFPEHLIRCSES